MYGKLTEDQWWLMARHVKDQTVYDLGAGDGYYSMLALAQGAEMVVAVDKSPVPQRHYKLLHERCYFSDLRAPYPGVDEVALVFWPVNYPTPGLVDLISGAGRVLYLGRNDGLTACGSKELHDHLLGRELLAYREDKRNDLLLYGGAQEGPHSARCREEEAWMELGAFKEDPML